MSDLTNTEIEGRLNALRDVVLELLREAPGEAASSIRTALERMSAVENHQEDPGTLPSQAFAVESARLHEINVIRAQLAFPRKTATRWRSSWTKGWRTAFRRAIRCR